MQTASFDPITSLSLVAFVFLNGIGSIAGGLAAGVAIAAGPAVLSTFIHVNGASWFQVLGGVGLISTMILHPNGALVRLDVPKRDRGRRLRTWLCGSAQAARHTAAADTGASVKPTKTEASETTTALLGLETISVVFGQLEVVRDALVVGWREENLRTDRPEWRRESTLFDVMTGYVSWRGRVVFDGRDITP